MICPQTTVGCYNSPQCKSAESCVMRLCNPPTDTEDIYRLAGDVSMALSALLAAIRKLDK